jgi:hypothetical protein
VAVGPTTKSIGLLLRAIIESLAGAANRFLYVLFNTTWSIVFFFAYWRNWTLAPLILFAVAVDLIGTDRDLCRKLVGEEVVESSWGKSKRHTISTLSC